MPCRTGGLLLLLLFLLSCTWTEAEARHHRRHRAGSDEEETSPEHSCFFRCTYEDPVGSPSSVQLRVRWCHNTSAEDLVRQILFFAVLEGSPMEQTVSCEASQQPLNKALDVDQFFDDLQLVQSVAHRRSAQPYCHYDCDTTAASKGTLRLSTSEWSIHVYTETPRGFCEPASQVAATLSAADPRKDVYSRVQCSQSKFPRGPPSGDSLAGQVLALQQASGQSGHCLYVCALRLAGLHYCATDGWCEDSKHRGHFGLPVGLGQHCPSNADAAARVANWLAVVPRRDAEGLPDSRLDEESDDLEEGQEEEEEEEVAARSPTDRGSGATVEACGYLQRSAELGPFTSVVL